MPKTEKDRAANEIAEITPQMREAGASVVQELSGVVDSEALAAAVYSAMVRQEKH